MPKTVSRAESSSRVTKGLQTWRSFFGSVKTRIPIKLAYDYTQHRPFVSFFIALGILLLLIIFGNIVGTLSKSAVKQSSPVRSVSVYRVGRAPKVILQGQVEKSGVFKIVAQTAGIVSQINFTEGDSVSHGQTIMSLASNYSGGSAPALQAQLAQRQYQNILDTYDTQKSIIEAQKTVATASATNTDKLRDISQQNLNDTNSLIDQNNDILTTLNSQLQTLQTNNVNGVNDQQILQLKQGIAQLRGGLLQLQTSARSLSYQTDQNNPPTLLSNTQKDIALKQLDIQQKSLDLNKEVSRIQAGIANITASLMTPTAPCNGTVDRIFVKEGDNVTPGTVLALISGDNQSSNVIVRVPFQIATTVSQTEESVLHIGSQSFTAMPSYISRDATDGQLYTIMYAVPSQYQRDLTQSGYMTVDIPVGFADTSSVISFIPLDAVYQTQNEAYILVVENKKAVTRPVQLGDVYGRFVQVLSGIHDNDKIILNRNILAGDSITITN